MEQKEHFLNTKSTLGTIAHQSKDSPAALPKNPLGFHWRKKEDQECSVLRNSTQRERERERERERKNRLAIYDSNQSIWTCVTLLTGSVSLSAEVIKHPCPSTSITSSAEAALIKKYEFSNKWWLLWCHGESRTAHTEATGEGIRAQIIMILGSKSKLNIPRAPAAPHAVLKRPTKGRFNIYILVISWT